MLNNWSLLYVLTRLYQRKGPNGPHAIEHIPLNALGSGTVCHNRLLEGYSTVYVWPNKVKYTYGQQLHLMLHHTRTWLLNVFESSKKSGTRHALVWLPPVSEVRTKNKEPPMSAPMLAMIVTLMQELEAKGKPAAAVKLLTDKGFYTVYIPDAMATPAFGHKPPKSLHLNAEGSLLLLITQNCSGGWLRSGRHREWEM